MPTLCQAGAGGIKQHPGNLVLVLKRGIAFLQDQVAITEPLGAITFSDAASKAATTSDSICSAGSQSLDRRRLPDPYFGGAGVDLDGQNSSGCTTPLEGGQVYAAAAHHGALAAAALAAPAQSVWKRGQQGAQQHFIGVHRGDASMLADRFLRQSLKLASGLQNKACRSRTDGAGSRALAVGECFERLNAVKHVGGRFRLL